MAEERFSPRKCNAAPRFASFDARSVFTQPAHLCGVHRQASFFYNRAASLKAIRPLTMETFMTNKTASRSAPSPASKPAASSTASKAGANDGTDKSAWMAPEFPTLDFAAVVGAQMEGAKAMGEVSSMLAKMAQDLATRQVAFVKSTMETVQKAASGASEPDLTARLGRQSETYRELMESSAQHVSEVAATVASCCCDAVDHLTEAGARPAKKSSSKTGA